MSNAPLRLTPAQATELWRLSLVRLLLGGLGIGLLVAFGLLMGCLEGLVRLAHGGLPLGMVILGRGLFAWDARLDPFTLLWDGVQGVVDGRTQRTERQTITACGVQRVGWDHVLVADDGTHYPLTAAIAAVPRGTPLTMTYSPRTRRVWAVTLEGGTQ